jgi:hypothetical protein
MEVENSSYSDNRPVLRDDLGRFLPNSAPGPGRPISRTSAKLALVKDRLLDAFLEMDIKAEFASRLRGRQFLDALKILLSISSKSTVELSEDDQGRRSVKITKEDSDSMRQ